MMRNTGLDSSFDFVDDDNSSYDDDEMMMMTMLQYEIPPHAPIELIFDEKVAIRVKGIIKRKSGKGSSNLMKKKKQPLPPPEPLDTVQEEDEDEEEDEERGETKREVKEEPRATSPTSSSTSSQNKGPKNSQVRDEFEQDDDSLSSSLESLVGLYVDSLDLPGLRMSHFPQTKHFERLLKANSSVPRRITFRAFPPPPLPLPPKKKVSSNPLSLPPPKTLEDKMQEKENDHQQNYYWSGGCLYRHLIPASAMTMTMSSTSDEDGSDAFSKQATAVDLGLVLEGFPPVIKSVQPHSFLAKRAKVGQTVHAVEAPSYHRQPLLDRHTPGFTAARVLEYLQEDTVQEPVRYLTLRDPPPSLTQKAPTIAYQDHHNTHLLQDHRGSCEPIDVGGLPHPLSTFLAACCFPNQPSSWKNRHRRDHDDASSIVTAASSMSGKSSGGKHKNKRHSSSRS